MKSYGYVTENNSRTYCSKKISVESDVPSVERCSEPNRHRGFCGTRPRPGRLRARFGPPGAAGAPRSALRFSNSLAPCASFSHVMSQAATSAAPTVDDCVEAALAELHAAHAAHAVGSRTRAGEGPFARQAALRDVPDHVGPGRQGHGRPGIGRQAWQITPALPEIDG